VTTDAASARGGRTRVSRASRMATSDAAWLHMDRPTNLMVVNCVFWFSQPLDWTAVAAAFKERLLPAFPHFAQRVIEPTVTFGAVAPGWEPAQDFDVQEHLQPATLPAPGGDAELHDYVSQHAAVPLDPGQPLWQAHLLDGYRGGSAILLRTHHALADGTALVQALLTLVDSSPDQGAPAGLRTFADKAPDGSWLRSAANQAGRATTSLLGAWTSVITRPGRGLAAARSWRAANAMLTRLGFAKKDELSAIRAQLTGTKHLTWTTPMPLDSIKTAGKRVGATVNDVALTAIAGALRAHLAQQGEEVSRLTAVVPVNLRAVDEPFDPDRGNQFGLAFVRLPVGEPDRLARLHAVRAAMNRVKSTDEALVVYGALAVVGQTPKQLEQAWLDLFAGRASAVITNIAGPSQPVSLAGVPLSGFTAWVPSTGPIGVGLSVCSYAGNMTLGVAVDEACVPNSDALLKVLTLELESVVDTLNAAAIPG
jgi:diacylglycerol O-acyltransferase / wax synthase